MSQIEVDVLNYSNLALSKTDRDIPQSEHICTEKYFHRFDTLKPLASLFLDQKLSKLLYIVLFNEINELN